MTPLDPMTIDHAPYTLAAVRTMSLTPRRVSNMTLTYSNYHRCECDSHADTAVMGRGALIVTDYNKPVQVQGYDPALGTTTYPTVSAVWAYDHPNGYRYHLLWHQAISIPTLAHSLISPFQCRVNDVVINDVPKFLTRHPTAEDHAIVVVDPDDPTSHLILPLELDGVVSYLPVHQVTRADFDSGRYSRIDMTNEHLTWDPQSSWFADQEASMTDLAGNVVRYDTPLPRQVQPYFIEAVVSYGHDLLNDPFDLCTALEAHCNIRIGAVRAVSQIDSRPGPIRSTAIVPIDHLTLAARWGIPPARAKQTVRVTTQRGTRTMTPYARRYPTNDRMLRYSRVAHKMFCDTLAAGTPSRRGNKYAQVFATNFGWCRVYPMRLKSQAHEALSILFKREGVPPDMICDGSLEQTKGNFSRKCREADCHLQAIEPYSPWMNSCETTIRELKRASSRAMLRTQSPKCLWDDCLELTALIRSNTALDIYDLNGETPETKLKGSTSDISTIAEFSWYDWCMFLDDHTYPADNWVLGRWLGPSQDFGPAMCAKLLKHNGQQVHRSSYRHLTREELDSPAHITLRSDFDRAILAKLGPHVAPADFPTDDLTPEWAHYDTDLFHDQKDDPIEGTPDNDHVLEPTPEVADNYLSMEILFPRGDAMARGRVISRKRDADGNPTGRQHDNPILDTRVYNVQFDDGEISELAANVIAENLYAQCDPEGNQYILLEGLVDYRRNDTATTLIDQRTIHNGRPSVKKNTIGWQICCQWRDGSTSWEHLRDLKESHPVETAEFAVAHAIDHEPAFNWWVPHVLRKRESIIALVKKRQTRYLKRTHKFGIELPKTVDNALALDKKNGNTYWADAINKEIKNVRVAFKILDTDERPPVGYQFIRCHMVFDIKIEDFQRKARFVAGGHMTEPPATLTYASVVSRETVRIALTIAALNDLEVKAGDIQNAYLTAPITERVWTVLGPEFGGDQGARAVIIRALYGLKSAGAAFRSHLARAMREMGYTSCLADPDLWYKPQTRPDDHFDYYSYILCYVDDILCIHHDAMTIMNKLNGRFRMKDGSVGDPDIYLGTKLKQARLANGIRAWGMSPSKYVQEATETCRKHLTVNFDGQYKLPKSAENPFPLNYSPEMDVTEVLDADTANYFQSLIGVMRWMVEIGRIDIATEVSMLSSHLAMPRKGHLECALHTMSYLSKKHNSRLVFDPTYPDISWSDFKHHDWEEFYGPVTEAIPPDAPKPLGKEIDIRMFVDSDHAGDKTNCRS